MLMEQKLVEIKHLMETNSHEFERKQKRSISEDLEGEKGRKKNHKLKIFTRKLDSKNLECQHQ